MDNRHLFNRSLGRQLALNGMEMAAEARADALAYARAVAFRLGRGGAPVTADDVQAVLIEQNIDLGNAAGSIFRGAWELFGYTKSTRVSNHGRVIGVWRLPK